MSVAGSPRAYPPPTNALAIIAFVLAFVMPLGAIVCGHIAIGQIRRTGEQGHGLALAGTILGWVFTGLIALMVLAWLSVMLSIFGVVLGTAGGLPAGAFTR